MALTLHLGVADQPYDYRPATVKATKGGKRQKRRARGKAKAVAKQTAAMTTYGVASILEAKYGVMEHFFEAHKSEIEKILVDTLQQSLDQMMSGGSGIKLNTYLFEDIKKDFDTFISSMEAERVGIAGTPTKAALKGVNHRLAHPYAKSNPRRPSFRDTGNYVQNFAAWID